MAEKTLPPIIMEVENSPFGDKFYTSSVWPQKFHVTMKIGRKSSKGNFPEISTKTYLESQVPYF